MLKVNYPVYVSWHDFQILSLGGTSYMAAHPMSVHGRIIEQQRASF